MKKFILLSLLLLTSCNSRVISSSITSQFGNISTSNNSSSSNYTDNSIDKKGYLMISIPQDQIYYRINESINLQDIEIYLIYIDDYSKVKIEIDEVKIEDVDMSVAGEKRVNVEYKQYTGYFIIYVGSKLESPSNLSINSPKALSA